MKIKMKKQEEYRPPFEIYKSNICHYVKDMGDVEFINEVIRSDMVIKYLEKEWLPESLYLLAMIDYLCRENNLPICEDYEILRHLKLEEILYPSGILILSAATKSEEPKERSLRESIPEFLRHNIVEAEVRRVA